MLGVRKHSRGGTAPPSAQLVVAGTTAWNAGDVGGPPDRSVPGRTTTTTSGSVGPTDDSLPHGCAPGRHEPWAPATPARTRCPRTTGTVGLAAAGTDPLRELIDRVHRGLGTGTPALAGADAPAPSRNQQEDLSPRCATDRTRLRTDS